MKLHDYMVVTPTNELMADTLKEARAIAKDVSKSIDEIIEIRRWDYVVNGYRYECPEISEDFEIRYFDGKELKRR